MGRHQISMKKNLKEISKKWIDPKKSNFDEKMFIEDIPLKWIDTKKLDIENSPSLLYEKSP